MPAIFAAFRSFVLTIIASSLMLVVDWSVAQALKTRSSTAKPLRVAGEPRSLPGVKVNATGIYSDLNESTFVTWERVTEASSEFPDKPGSV
ncbi:hypothetical protein LZ554_004243 [Drepanopeziza brunnea f. sp. 'monogermtubi']|nr:hypothetical protein LZ554_004243 [Drepanopeziza brunnea f. sp. 'monogermtubi']